MNSGHADGSRREVTGIGGTETRRAGRVSRLRSWARPRVRRLVDRLSVGEGTVERVPVADVLLAIVLFIPSLLLYAAEPGEGISHTSLIGIAGWIVLVAMFGVLAWRRVAPSLTMAVAGLATGAWFLVGFADAFIPTAVMVALYSVTAYGSRSDGVASLVITEFFVVASFASIIFRGGEISLVVIGLNLLLFVGLWLLGERTRVRRELMLQYRERAEQAERSRELATELAVAEERRRIARELHDVVAHTVGVMVVQAGAGRRIAAREPDRALDTLAAIETVGRDALSDLRRMVGVLRDETAEQPLTPQPTLEALPELVRRLTDAGLPVQLETPGSPAALPSGIEVSAYRIVQEALTNVLKHAGAVREVRVCVDVDVDRDVLEIVVTDDGHGGTGAGDLGGAGSGLAGMRERVALFGGTLDAGPHPGGYRVHAHLPLPSARTSERARTGDDGSGHRVGSHEVAR